MGECLILTCAVIDDDKTPDWDAAQQLIDGLTVEQFEDNAKLQEQFDPDLITHHDDSSVDADAREQLHTGPLRARLHADLHEFREGLNGDRADIDYLLVRGAKVWVTGGMSFGDEPSELCSPIHRLHLAGVLAAAGFDSAMPSDAAGENAGCDRCGTNDRAADSRYCQACIDDGYFVYVHGRLETGYLHDTAADAREEALLVAEQVQDEPVEVRGPRHYRETIDGDVSGAEPAGGAS
jgi:hypothetical protein